MFQAPVMVFVRVPAPGHIVLDVKLPLPPTLTVTPVADGGVQAGHTPGTVITLLGGLDVAGMASQLHRVMMVWGGPD